MWHFSRQNFQKRKLRSVLPKTVSKSFFLKTRFRSVFTKPPLSPIFEAKQNMWNVSRQNFHSWKLRSLLPKSTPKWFFQKTRSSPILQNRPPHLFLGPNRLCGTFRGKIFTGENFPRFCLKRPRNCFSEKHVSCLFLQNRPSPIF